MKGEIQVLFNAMQPQLKPTKAQAAASTNRAAAPAADGHSRLLLDARDKPIKPTCNTLAAQLHLLPLYLLAASIPCSVTEGLQLSNDGIGVFAAGGLATQVAGPVLAICTAGAKRGTAWHSMGEG